MGSSLKINIPCTEKKTGKIPSAVLIFFFFFFKGKGFLERAFPIADVTWGWLLQGETTPDVMHLDGMGPGIYFLSCVRLRT